MKREIKRRGKARAAVIIRVMEMTLKQNLTDGFVIFTVLIQPLLVALLGIWMLQDKGPEYAIYIVVGSGMSGLWSSLVFISGNAVNVERWFGTLETLIGVPTPLSAIVFGKNLAHVLQSLGSILLCYVLASAFFGYPLTVAMPLPFAVSLLCVVLAFICFGLLIAPLFVLNPQIASFQNGLEFPVYVVSGFLFPIAMLPLWTVPISYALPTYWAAKAMHASARASETLGSIAFSWLVLLLTSVVYAGIGVILFRVVIRKAKEKATLDAF
ncbi:MAG: ABC transporter permease [Spirochaetales bacterium]|nr:ABC transporter permease [Spirochaetales bacterium]